MVKRRVNKLSVVVTILIILLAGFVTWWMAGQYSSRQNCDNDRDCFYEAYVDNCVPANFKADYLTIEGDPIVTSASLEVNPNGGCNVMVTHDGSQDKFGDGRVHEYICTDLIKDGNHLRSDNCKDESGEDNVGVSI